MPDEPTASGLIPVDALDASGPARPLDLGMLYESVRRTVPGGGPPLQVIQASRFVPSLPCSVHGQVRLLFERALRRIHFQPTGGIPALAARIDLEEDPGAGTLVAVVRLYDTGPIADPPNLPPVVLASKSLVSFRREPPTGLWSGVAALRIFLRPPHRY